MGGVYSYGDTRRLRLLRWEKPFEGIGTYYTTERLCVKVEAAGERRDELAGVEGAAGGSTCGACAGYGRDCLDGELQLAAAI